MLEATRKFSAKELKELADKEMIEGMQDGLLWTRLARADLMIGHRCLFPKFPSSTEDCAKHLDKAAHHLEIAHDLLGI